jgi:hypothetical protein
MTEKHLKIHTHKKKRVEGEEEIKKGERGSG